MNLYSTIQSTLEDTHVTFEGKAKRFLRKIICKQQLKSGPNLTSSW